MTSKHLFFKAMREDLRHKIWMIALSSLASFLAFPVAWLMGRSYIITLANSMRDVPLNVTMPNVTEETMRIAAELGDFLYLSTVASGGIIAGVGAVITGLFGFRYVFNRGMVDTYHSIPVKRNTLYAVCYVNGILIWLVPFLLGLCAALGMACGLVGQLGGAAAVREMVGDVCVSAAAVAVVYLLVYHLVLTAVMLSGNILNTLAAMGILGFGGFACFMIWFMFCNAYLDTFFTEAVNWQSAAYLSPFVSAPCLLTLLADSDTQIFWAGMPVNFGISVFLGLCAFLLYLRRPSETAGHGIGNRYVAALFRIVVSVAAGMCGWMFFVQLTANVRSLPWGIFGAVFVGVLVFGVLDIIFRMDFKAFFAHKIQMGACVALALLLGAAFRGDWFGYDAYLPDKEEIAEIAVSDWHFANRNQSYGDGGTHPLRDMHLRDAEAAYAFLESVTARQGYGTVEEVVSARVTLKNGKSYYRTYWAAAKDRELLLELLLSPEYLESAYVIDEAWVAGCDGYVDTADWRREYGVDQEDLRSIVRAYNQDLAESPERVVLGGGKLLAQVSFRSYATGSFSRQTPDNFCLEVYDGMEHTLEALRQAGFGDALEVDFQVRAVRLGLGGSFSVLVSGEELVEAARQRYGTDDEQMFSLNGYSSTVIYGDIPASEEFSMPAEVFRQIADTESTDFALSIDDPGEVAELMELLSWREPTNRTDSIFKAGYVYVDIFCTDGSSKTMYIPKGALPEKYILRFGDLAVK